MAIRLNDEQCLLWIKDPSISPFENNRVPYKIRRNILSEANIKNPKSFLNRVKRKCFYNSAIRQQIVDKIKEYKENKIPRLYTLNDKLKNAEKIQLDTQYDKFENIEYITPPFTIEECERWINNHLENPRPNDTIKTTTLTPSTTKVYEKKVTIKQLSSLITNEELTETFLHQLVNKIDVEIPLYDDHYNLIIIDPTEKVNKENEMKQHISNMIIKRRDGVSIKEHLDFIKKLLQYWTALNYFNRNGEYNIIYKYGQGINVQKLPEAHTCSNAIDVYGFPNNYTAEQKDDFLYGKFKWAVEATEMELH